MLKKYCVRTIAIIVTTWLILPALSQAAAVPSENSICDRNRRI